MNFSSDLLMHQNYFFIYYLHPASLSGSASSFILSKIPILCQEVFLSERLILLFVFQNSKNLYIRLKIMSDTRTTREVEADYVNEACA
jgi:hypothetical protein